MPTIRPLLLLLICINLPISLDASPSWLQFKGDARHSGNAPDVGIPSQPRLATTQPKAAKKPTFRKANLLPVKMAKK
ncbi:MAG: hypothetical protein L3J39_09755 [Verrucomicrobiales bacterium]|nr:hypothetical protein [Verrucomicrobiales bacterium]